MTQQRPQQTAAAQSACCRSMADDGSITATAVPFARRVKHLDAEEEA